MQKNTRIIESEDADKRLEGMGLASHIFPPIGRAGLAPRLETTDNDSPTAKGSYSHYACIRSLRDVILQYPGWEKYSFNNIAGVQNRNLGLILLYKTVDRACQKLFLPQPISEVGPLSKKIIASGNQLNLFGEDLPHCYIPQAACGDAVWWLCVSYCDDRDTFSMEFSRPIMGSAKKNVVYAERIFIAKDAGLNYDLGPVVKNPTPGGPGDDIAVMEIEPGISKRT